MYGIWGQHGGSVEQLESGEDPDHKWPTKKFISWLAKGRGAYVPYVGCGP